MKFPYERNQILVNDCRISDRKGGYANSLHKICIEKTFSYCNKIVRRGFLLLFFLNKGSPVSPNARLQFRDFFLKTSIII